MKLEKKVLIEIILLIPCVFWLSYILVPKSDWEMIPPLRLVDFDHIQPTLSVEERKWAYGDDWNQITSAQAVDQWNERHGDLFLVEMTDSVEKTNKRIKEHFEKLK